MQRPSTTHETLKAKSLVPATSAVKVGTLHSPAGELAHPTTYAPSGNQAGLTITMTATQFLGGHLHVDNVTISGESTDCFFRFPSAETIVGYFTAAGRPLEVGDEFLFYISRGVTGTRNIILYPSTDASTTFANGVSTIAVQRFKTMLLTLRVTALGTAPHISLYYLVGYRLNLEE
jgi:hypothetical protein